MSPVAGKVIGLEGGDLKRKTLEGVSRLDTKEVVGRDLSRPNNGVQGASHLLHTPYSVGETTG